MPRLDALAALTPIPFICIYVLSGAPVPRLDALAAHTHTQVRPASLQAAGPRGADGTGVWSIPALLAVLQFAFPRAAVSCPAAVGAEDRWNAPPPGATGPPQRAFRRAIELARAKVIKPLF